METSKENFYMILWLKGLKCHEVKAEFKLT